MSPRAGQRADTGLSSTKAAPAPARLSAVVTHATALSAGKAHIRLIGAIAAQPAPGEPETVDTSAADSTA